ncbi:MAG TPA: hypothetical protein VGR90_09960 [Acidimicrobiales bacterium]|nr:hypothetical protein [Acidimicrobiales bacterium]
MADLLEHLVRGRYVREVDGASVYAERAGHRLPQWTGERGNRQCEGRGAEAAEKRAARDEMLVRL